MRIEKKNLVKTVIDEMNAYKETLPVAFEGWVLTILTNSFPPGWNWPKPFIAEAFRFWPDT